MAEYKMVRLGEICEQINGVSYKPADVYDSLTEKTKILLRANNIFEDKLNYDELVFVDKKRISENQYMKKGDILICASSGSKHLVGKAACLTEDKDLTFGAFCKVLRPKTVNPEYIKHYFFSPSYRTEISRLSEGANINNIKAADLDNLKIPLPSESIQNKIAKRLDKCVKIINNQKKALEKYDILIKSRFIEMFGNPQCISNNWKVNPLSDYCIVNPKKSELGPIPDDYELSFIPMQSVSENGDVDTSSIKHYKDVKTGFTYFRENDVLFAKITPCMENGKGGVARKLKNQIGFGSTEFHVLRPIETISNSEWIYRLTTFKTFRKDAENNMTGSAGQRRTPKEFFDKYKVGLPPIELQNDFAAFVQQIDKSKFEIANSLKRLYNKGMLS